MTGLDKILQEIQREADQSAAAILDEERRSAAALVEEAKRQAQEECERLRRQAQAQEEDALNRARSAAELQKRKTILAAKQEIIGETIEKARESLYALPENQYFELILKMAKKYARKEDGEIQFSAKDLQRLPAGFEAQVAQAAGAKLKISEKPGNITGGFVLSYGGIEENCSFEAIFDAQHDVLQDKVHEVLFA